MDKTFLKIAITPEVSFPEETEAIKRVLIDRDFDLVHIRKPKSPTEVVASIIEAVPLELRHRLTLHDCFELAPEYGVGGLHLNSRNPLPLPHWNGRISKSCHSPEECLFNTQDYDYVTLSPIFPSISKQGYGPSFTPEDIISLLEKKNRPQIIAMGGIYPHLLPWLREIKFDGAAMLGAAWNNIEAKFHISDFCLQFITNPISVEDAVGQAKAALEGGCRWIQLRWKDADDEQFLMAAQQILPLCKEKDAFFILNDRADLVEAINADGVHLGKNDMNVRMARKLIGDSKIIGRTANTTEDMMEGFLQGADYIGMGPFRFTTTKKNLSPVLGEEGYRKAKSFLSENGLEIPIVAIGGITEDDIQDIISIGVEGIAVSGVIAISPHPTETTDYLVKLVKFSRAFVKQ